MKKTIEEMLMGDSADLSDPESFIAYAEQTFWKPGIQNDVELAMSQAMVTGMLESLKNRGITALARNDWDYLIALVKDIAEYTGNKEDLEERVAALEDMKRRSAKSG